MRRRRGLRCHSGAVLLGMIFLMSWLGTPTSEAMAARPGLAVMDAGSNSKTRVGEKSPATMPAPAKRKLMSAYARQPLGFEKNEGQTDPQFKFLTRGADYSMYLSSQKMSIWLQHPGLQNPGLQRSISQSASGSGGSGPSTGGVSAGADNFLDIALVGASALSSGSAVDELPGKSNYFHGNDPSRWHTNVARYQKVRYSGIYPGIDLVYYGNQRQVEHDFVVSPAGDPGQIILQITGATSMLLNQAGDAVLHLEHGDVVLKKPALYQQVAAARREITGGYILRGANRLGFAVGDYDHSLPLVIDPMLLYKTDIGGSGFEQTAGIAVDGSGNAYLTGTTGSKDFPVKNPEQAACGGGCSLGFDAFVTKLDPTGAIVYSTYLGEARRTWD